MRPVAECLADFGNALRKRVIADGQIGPAFGQQIVLCDRPFRICGEAAQYGEGARPQVDTRPGWSPHLLASKVHHRSL